MKKNIKQQTGQVVLMVLLASALILTLGLSASKQATVETKIETDQELLKKAFNAAESGIEYYLGTGNTTYNTESDEGSASLSTKTVGDSETLSSDEMILNGSFAYFWLVNHTENGDIGSTYYSDSSSQLKICNGHNGEAGETKFKLSYYYKSGEVYGVRNVEAETSGGCVSNFDLNVDGSQVDSLLLSVMPIGGDSVMIEISGGTKFPIQGEEISSTGVVSGVNNTVRVVNKYVVPEFMLEAVSSGGDVSN